MPLVRPAAPDVFRDQTLLGQVWCDFFARALVQMAVLRGYKKYNVLLADPALPTLVIQFDGKYTVQVSPGPVNDVILELLAHDGDVLSTFTVKLSLLYGRNPIAVSRLFSQRLTGYLP